jgi:hypothetical protein
MSLRDTWAKKSGRGMTQSAFVENQNNRSSTGGCKSLGSFALDVRGFVAVNEVGLGSLIDGGSQFTHGSGSCGFVACGQSFGNFFAKRSDAAFGSAVAFRAHFGLTDALLGRFGVGHDKEMTELKMIERRFRECGARNLPFLWLVSRKRRQSQEKNLA